MSTYSLDTDANTFDWNSSPGATVKPSLFVCLSGCLWALLECDYTPAFLMGIDVHVRVQYSKYIICARACHRPCERVRAWVSTCVHVPTFTVRLPECGSLSSQCDWQQPLIGLSPSGPELPLGVFKAYRHRGEKETYRQPTRTVSAQCMWVWEVTLMTERRINVCSNETEVLLKWKRGSRVFPWLCSCMVSSTCLSVCVWG